jgi:hypothetical protein
MNIFNVNRDKLLNNPNSTSTLWLRMPRQRVQSIHASRLQLRAEQEQVQKLLHPLSLDTPGANLINDCVDIMHK